MGPYGPNNQDLYRKANNPAAPYLPPPPPVTGAPVAPPPGAPAPLPVPTRSPAPPVQRVVPVAPAASVPQPGEQQTQGQVATNEFMTPEQRQAREAQWRAVNEAIGAIEGKTPSVTQLEMQRNNNAAQAQQASLAAGARGMSVAGARRQAAHNIGQLQQGLVGQTALLRANEIASARQQLADISGQVRAQDIQTTSSGAEMIDRAKKLSNDWEIALKDLDLREKLGLLQDSRERVHLDEMRRSNLVIEDLKRRGLDLEARRLEEEMKARNREFWGGLIAGVATGGASVAASPATSVAGKALLA